MQPDISKFNNIATPVLKNMAAHFPNAIDVSPNIDLSGEEKATHQAVIRFLVSEGFINSTHNAKLMTLTAKGLGLFNCNIAQALNIAL
ncbi:MAG: hypothetical protein HRU24_05940 [Gammaproteobacteria bacterium]|nr:hypothetical protein [Gammaproteobacteria bacterium]